MNDRDLSSICGCGHDRNDHSDSGNRCLAEDCPCNGFDLDFYEDDEGVVLP